MINILLTKGAEVSYYDPYIPNIRNCACGQTLSSVKDLNDLGKYDAVAVVTDHSDIDYKKVLEDSKVIVDSRNAFRNIKSDKIIRI